MESFLLLNTASKPARGFTLVEMMVVLSIIAVVTSIVLVGQTTFNRSILLTDAAYTFALSLRQAQSYGLSSRVFSGVQNAGYGAHLSSATPTSYVLFADTHRAYTPPTNCVVGTAGTPDAKPGDCFYSAGNDGIVQTYTFNQGYRISEFCGTQSDGTRYCSTDGALPLTDLSISFLRSSTETMPVGWRNSTLVPFTKAEVYIQSSDGSTTRGICVSRVGQVAITLSTCP